MYSALVTTMFAIIGGLYAFDQVYAHNTRVALLESSFDTYRTQQKLDDVNHRLWDRMDKLQTTKSPELKEQLKLEIRELEEEKNREMKNLDLINKQERQQK